MHEWQASIELSLSISYLERAKEVETLFNEYLKTRKLADQPISAIKVRDIEIFFHSLIKNGYRRNPRAKVIKDLPKQVNFRQLAREGIITRVSSYGMRRKGNRILKDVAVAICEYYQLNFSDYFESIEIVKPYALETLKGYRRVLRTLFNEAVRYEWIVRNPVASTKIGSGNSNVSLRPVHEKEVFSFRETRDFISRLDALPPEEINRKVPIKLMLFTGVRTAELCGLRWSDVDLERQVLHIRRNRLYSSRIGVYEKTPKTRTSLRDIPIPNAIIADLKEYMEWFRIADKDFDNNLDKYYVAVNAYRETIFPGSVSQYLKAYERKWGIKRVTCHGLRHTYCSLLLSQNVPIQTVSRYMGHSDSTVTLKVYSHFIPDTQDIALQALDNLE